MMIITLKKIWYKYNYYKLRKRQLAKLKTLRTYGANNYICNGVQFFTPEKISLGDHVWIGNNVKIDGRGSVQIGSGCILARDIEIISSNHYFQGEDLLEIPYDKRFLSKPVVIQENVWMGIRAVILPGVTIGEGAVIGACSVVTKDIPPLAIVGGNPARVLRYRDADQYYRLKEEGKIYLKENYNYDISPDRLK